MQKEAIIKEISSFLEGHNDLKYLVNVETYYHTNYADCIIHHPEKEPALKRIQYTPFVYLKNLEKNGIELFGGDINKRRDAEQKFEIKMENLATGKHPRLEDGFTIKVSSTKSYNAILEFLKQGGIDMWEKYELTRFKDIKFPLPLPSFYNEEFHSDVVKLLKQNNKDTKKDDDKGGSKVDNKIEALNFISKAYYEFAGNVFKKSVLKWANDLCDFLLKLIKNEYKYKHLFYSIKPDEQFFISTGCRLYKGFEDYEDLHKLVFDIETTSLKWQNGRIFQIGVRDNRGFEEILEVKKENDDEEEKGLIIKFFNLVNHIKPAVIAGFNSEDFDFDFILGRAGILGINLSLIRTTLDNTEYVDKDGVRRFSRRIKKDETKKSSVKFGGTTERYKATKMWGYSILDILHAVKKTAAVNSEIKSNKLKYICKFEKIAKPNRMYVDGEFIHETWRENKVYIINPENNEYERVPLQYQDQAVHLYDLQLSQADEETRKNLRNSILSQMSPEAITWLKSKTVQYGKYKFIKGADIVRRYLLDDLWETDKVDSLYNQSSFLLAKIVPTSYQRVCTMGNAAVWNLIMTTWSYENGLAIPCPDKQEKFSGGLARCFKKGFSENITKIDFKGMYPSNQLHYGIFPTFDITGVIKKILLYLTTTRNEFKFLAGDKSPLPKDQRNKFKVKQLPIKILNNSLFGALGSGVAFNWSDNICAARITCTGRIQLRQAITYFKKYTFVPLLAVTDGINFSYPKFTLLDIEGNVCREEPISIEDAWVYESGGKKYTGVEAVVEKFNDLMDSPYIGVDLDGMWQSSLNLSRINYANLTEESIDEKTGKVVPPKIKLTGNTIKSKTMSEYIEDFIDKGLKLILMGKGDEFVEYYNEYLKKIYYKQIPLKKIATKKKLKNSISTYVNRGNDKTGKKKAKQAHMELLIQQRNQQVIAEYEKIYGQDDSTLEEKYQKAAHMLPPEPEQDSYVYYVNIGTKPGHGDSAMIKNEKGEDIIASQLISPKDLEENPEMTGDYNVGKYVASFNKRVSALLEGFAPEIRKQILIKDPAKREYFGGDELKLKNFDADDYEESLVLEEKELEFWNRTGYNPELIWKGFKLPAENALEELDEYQEKIKTLNDKLKESNQNKVVKSVNDTLEKGDFVLIKNFRVYDLYHFNGLYLSCARKDLFADKDMKEYDFLNAGMSKATFGLKTQFVKKFKNQFNIPDEVKLSTIPRGVEIFEEYYAIELAALKKLNKKKKMTSDDEYYDLLAAEAYDEEDDNDEDSEEDDD